MLEAVRGERTRFNEFVFVVEENNLERGEEGQTDDGECV